MQHYTIPINMTVAPFSDNNVRMALKHAIDREAIVQPILHGYGSVGNDSPIAPTNRYFNADIAQRVYDPDKARDYVKQSGLGTLAVELSAADAAFADAASCTGSMPPEPESTSPSGASPMTATGRTYG